MQIRYLKDNRICGIKMKKIFKKVVTLGLALAMVFSLAACSGAENGDSTGEGTGTEKTGDKQDAVAKYGSDTLKIFLPGAYMEDSLVPDFEKKFGVKVIVENFDSNEMMYTKLSAGDSYDVLIPSDYMIERLLKEDALQPLDKSMIPNMSNLADQTLNMVYDPDNTYSAPYFWGNVGLVYNHNNVPSEEVEAKGFDILKDTKYKGHIYMYDSERDGFMIAFKQLGYSCNTDNEAEIEAAYNWLVELNQTMDPVYVTDEVIDAMANGQMDIAIVYSGDAAYILDENENMSYFAPNCGTNIWVDAMVIPKNAENPKLANEFINYFLDNEVCRKNTGEVGYASANRTILAEMTAEGGDYAENEAYLPRTYEKDEVFRDNEALRKKLSELWIKVKAAK